MVGSKGFENPVHGHGRSIIVTELDTDDWAHFCSGRKALEGVYPLSTIVYAQCVLSGSAYVQESPLVSAMYILYWC